MAAAAARGIRVIEGSERRKATATSAFGVSKRENHDASDFYARFPSPELSDDERVNPPGVVDQLYVGDARDMQRVQPNSVALVVTSPPYFAGKAYEAALGEGHIPATYVDYLQMLEDVFAECVRKLEPGGRIAVNVANLGRKPYRSLSADVITILQDRLRLLLRGEIVWQKARGAGGSCAWGSFRKPSNPVLRDLTERVVIASKGRFDRAHTEKKRSKLGLPHEATTTADEFMDATLDVWELAPESATRVNHPAPFPIELPQRLIELYTWRNDVVLDPFMGSGTTAIAAVRTGRHYIGYDTDEAYVTAARERVGREAERTAGGGAASLPVGDKAIDTAAAMLGDAGFDVTVKEHKLPGGVSVPLTATAGGVEVLVEVVGAFTITRGGLRRTDVLHRALGRAAIQSGYGERPLLLLTTELPSRKSSGMAALGEARGRLFLDVLEIGRGASLDRLRAYATQGFAAPIGELLGPG